MKLKRIRSYKCFNREDFLLREGILVKILSQNDSREGFLSKHFKIKFHPEIFREKDMYAIIFKKVSSKKKCSSISTTSTDNHTFNFS